MALTEEELKEIDVGLKNAADNAKELSYKIIALRAKLKKEKKDVE